MPLPFALSPRYWTPRRITVLIGFVFALAGSLGAFTYVGPAQRRAGALDEPIREVAARLETLKDAAARYASVEQQGALIVAISVANANEGARDALAVLRQQSLLDRSEAVRHLMDQLAPAGQPHDPQASLAYQMVIDAARRDATLETFLAVKAFEKDVASRAQARSGQLQAERTALLQQQAGAARVVERRALILVVLTAIGSTLLLAANLLAARAEVGELQA